MRMILARLTIFCGVFPSAISCCSCSRAFRSSTNRDSLCSIREMNHDHTRDSNVRDRTLGATFNASPGYKKTKQVNELNKNLNDLRSETSQLESLGQHVNLLRLGSVSLNVGQL